MKVMGGGNQNIQTFIFARGGSKGMPNKNILPFCGKPLICWTIETAKKVSGSHSVIVSTDSKEIAEIAVANGCIAPFKRPVHLASDTAAEWHAWQHALKFMVYKNKPLPQAMVILPVTAPLRYSSDVEDCISKFFESKVDAVITVSEARRHPSFNMVTMDKNDYMSLMCPPKTHVTRRQDAPEAWDIATVCYVLDPKFVLEQSSIFDGKIKAVEIPQERAIDIDTPVEFEIAENLMEKRGIE